jgi:2-C-methyl-D-erythritol 4-phosphate cytidylyltransferase
LSLPIDTVRFHVIVPAAGSARRMQQSVPKQYLLLHDRSVLEWALAPFLAHAGCAGVVVVIATDDSRWASSPLSRHAAVRAVNGGRERADSVLAGVMALREQCSDADWVLVHDAARPCLDAYDLQCLIAAVHDDEVGGLLAASVVDTLKRADSEQRVAATVARDGLWRALTPQMFRYGVLARALRSAAEQGLTITDESQAVELLGLSPKLVAGSGDNIKITLPDDITRAERTLAARTPMETT